MLYFLFIAYVLHTLPFGICYISVRLVGGSNSREGRLEVFHSGVWGTVCDHDFNNASARVICSMLGYGYAVVARAFALILIDEKGAPIPYDYFSAVCSTRSDVRSNTDSVL